jgi:hypothetical protein
MRCVGFMILRRRHMLRRVLGMNCTKGAIFMAGQVGMNLFPAPPTSAVPGSDACAIPRGGPEDIGSVLY